MAYPLVSGPTYVAISPAPETLNPRYENPDQRIGGSSGPATQGRVAGLQPGFNMPGIPVVALTPETISAIAGPQPG